MFPALFIPSRPPLQGAPAPTGLLRLLSRRSPQFRSILLRSPLLLAPLLLLPLAGCGGGAQGPSPAAGGAPATQRLDIGLGLGLTDRIEAFDLAVASSGRAAVVGVGRAIDAGAGRRAFTSFRASADDAWSTPMALPGAEPPLRLAALGDTLHLFAGPHVRHWIHRPNDLGWTEDTVLGLLPDLRAQTLDVLPVASGLLLATAARVSGGAVDSPDTDPLELCVLGWPRRPDRPPHILKDYAGVADAPAGPVLAARGDRLGLLVAVNAFGTRTITSNGRPVEVAESQSALHFYQSADGGRTWNGPDELPADPPAAGRGPAAAPPVTSVALVGRADGWYACHTVAGLFVARRADTGDWSLPQPVAAYRTGLAGGTGAWALNAHPTRGGVRLWWIDERNRRSDRKPWNPLGGFPWSDAPDWANNDLFSIALNPGGSGPAELTEESLLRLTPDLARAEHVRMAVGGGGLTLAWAGRARVGKQPNSAGEPPALFIQNQPQHEEE